MKFIKSDMDIDIHVRIDMEAIRQYKTSIDPPLHKTLQILNKNRGKNHVTTCRKKQRRAARSLFTHAQVRSRTQ